MSDISANNKRIAKNTLFLYVRMLFVMGVTLFTSRVILDKLGEVDYGLYNTVGGVVAMLSFLNGALSTGTSRFLTFELGQNSLSRLKKTFSTTFYTHLFLALAVAVIMETVGLWFVCNKLVIPTERLSAVLWVYQITIFTMMVSITQVPYTSVIIAHENMKIYAYLGIFEAVAKLVIVYLIVVSSWDKLIFYASLVAIVQVLVAVCYRIFCIRKYQESHIEAVFDKKIFRRMLSFSGLSFLANIAQVLSVQGLIVIINMFFQPAIVAAQSIGNQLSHAMMQFVNNLQTAINPQIIKLYAQGEYVESRKLTLQSSVYVFELTLLLGLPAIVVMDPLLHLWLVDVPQYTVIFAQYIVAKQIFNVYNGTLYIPMIASGKLGSNSIVSIWISAITFIGLYILFKVGFNVMWIQYVSMLQVLVFSCIVKPYILCKEIGYSWKEIYSSFYQCIKVACLPVAVSVFCSYCMTVKDIYGMATVVLVICLSVVISAYLFFDKSTRRKLHDFLIRKIKR